MNVDRIQALARTWREEAAVLRNRGAAGHADVLEGVAEELGQAIREWQLEPLTLEAAETESGYSRSTLERKLSSGEIQNAGGKGRPRVLRRDLPLKGGTVAPTTGTGDPDLAGMILASR